MPPGLPPPAAPPIATVQRRPVAPAASGSVAPSRSRDPAGIPAAPPLAAAPRPGASPLAAAPLRDRVPAALPGRGDGIGAEGPRRVRDEKPAPPLADEPRIAPQLTPVAAPAEVRRADVPAPLPPEARPVAPHVQADPTLALLVGASHARMTVQAGDAGSLQLRLSIHGDVAEIEARGSAAKVLEGHTGGLRAALAGEGLHLGAVTLPDGVAAGASGGERGGSSRREPPPEPPAPHPHLAPRPPRAFARAGRVHVLA